MTHHPFKTSQSVPVYLVTGFFGAGKTTFLKHALRDLGITQKIAVLMNEFGDVGVDGITLEDEPVVIHEINGGSIFCSCRHWAFIEALMELQEHQPDMVFIESSGMSDPTPIRSDLKILDSLIGSVYDYKGAICVVDASTVLELLGVWQIIERQLERSNLVIINKEDLVAGTNSLDKIKKRLIEINGSAKFVTASFAKIDFKHVTATLEGAVMLDSDKSINTPNNAPRKIILQTEDRTLTKEQFDAFIINISGRILRMKGFCLLDGSWYHVDGIKNSIALTRSSREREVSRLVVIFEDGVLDPEITLESWRSFVSKMMD
ncbi:MAG: CobW family GTP-binding protein [Promethearchaeota archaeon]